MKFLESTSSRIILWHVCRWGNLFALLLHLEMTYRTGQCEWLRLLLMIINALFFFVSFPVLKILRSKPQ